VLSLVRTGPCLPMIQQKFGTLHWRSNMVQEVLFEIRTVCGKSSDSCSQYGLAGSAEMPIFGSYHHHPPPMCTQFCFIQIRFVISLLCQPPQWSLYKVIKPSVPDFLASTRSPSLDESASPEALLSFFQPNGRASSIRFEFAFSQIYLRTSLLSHNQFLCKSNRR
jgi:hypothetical protein